MQPLPPFLPGKIYRHAAGVIRWTGVALASLAMAGCVGLWDEITSRNRDLKGYFFKPDPLQVLANKDRNNKDKDYDGAKRGQALAALTEPLANGGSREEQERLLKTLTHYALADPEPLCRLGALRALGKWKDERAVDILDQAFTQPPFIRDEPIQAIVREQALVSLEETGNPKARFRLILVAGQPIANNNKMEKQRDLDQRLTAIRALGKFKQSDVTEALVKILADPKDDVAARQRARQSLQEITGRNLPADAQAWRDFLYNSNQQIAGQPNILERVMFWKH